jgi:hypothetical protein
MFQCPDRASADWLKMHRNWEDRGCKTLEEGDFPREHESTGYFLRNVEMPTKQVLKMI